MSKHCIPLPQHPAKWTKHVPYQTASKVLHSMN